MPAYEITQPDGRRFTVDAKSPDEAAAAVDAVLRPPPGDGGANQRAGEFATGINNALGGLAGLPMDVSAWLGNKFGQGVNYATGSEIFTPRPTIGGSEQIKRGIEATVGRTDPTDATGRILARTGEAVGGTVGGAGIGLGMRAAGAAPAIADALIGGNTAGQQAVNVGLGVASGVGGGVGQEIGGPWGGLAGDLLGAMLPVGVYVGGRAAVDRLSARARAARELQGAAGDAAAQQAAVDRLGQETMGPFPEGMGPGEIIPGSLPATSQITGNTGIGDLERRLITQMPASADQRTAQQNQLWSLAETQRQARERFLGERAPGVPVEERGDTLRAPVLSALQGSEATERRLFEIIDPDKKATFDATPLRDAAKEIRQNVAPTEVAMSDQEKRIFDFVGLGGTAVPFERWQTTRRDLMAEMATQRAAGNGIAVRRMGQLLAAVDDTMSAAVARAAERDPIAAGQITELANAGRPATDAVAGRAPGEGAGLPLASQGAATQVAVPGGTTRTTGATGRQLATDAGDQGVSRTVFAESQTVPLAVPDNLPPEVAQRYREAAAFTRQQKETFQDNPYVGPLVERTGRGALEMQRADVPRQVLQNADSVNAYVRAGGDIDAVRSSLVDELAERLPGNKLTPAQFFNWTTRREGALRAAGLDTGAGGLDTVRRLQAEFERPLPPGSTMTGRATQRTATTVISKLGDALRKTGAVVSSASGAAAGASMFGPAGAWVGAVAPPVLNALQKAGINSKDKLLARAAVDPDFARLLLMRETPDNAPLIARGFDAWARTGVGGAAYAP